VSTDSQGERLQALSDGSTPWCRCLPDDLVTLIDHYLSIVPRLPDNAGIALRGSAARWTNATCPIGK
jgi:hypothetical protein